MASSGKSPDVHLFSKMKKGPDILSVAASEITWLLPKVELHTSLSKARVSKLVHSCEWIDVLFWDTDTSEDTNI